MVNFTISLALSAGTLMASAGTSYRLVPAHFYPWSIRLLIMVMTVYPAKRLGKRGPRNGAWLMGRGCPSERADEGALSSEDKCHVRR